MSAVPQERLLQDAPSNRFVNTVDTDEQANPGASVASYASGAVLSNGHQLVDISTRPHLEFDNVDQVDFQGAHTMRIVPTAASSAPWQQTNTFQPEIAVATYSYYVASTPMAADHEASADLNQQRGYYTDPYTAQNIDNVGQGDEDEIFQSQQFLYYPHPCDISKYSFC